MIKSISIKKSRNILKEKPLFFSGTRVPVNKLIDYLEAGEKVDDFLKKFPSVTQKQTLDAMKKHKEKLKQRLF